MISHTLISPKQASAEFTSQAGIAWCKSVRRYFNRVVQGFLIAMLEDSLEEHINPPDGDVK